jgi:predicted nucleotidyltransferase
MKPSVAFEQNRQFIREAAQRRKTTNPRVFGSVLHGTDLEGSDVDILVNTIPGTTSLFDLGGLQADLEDRLGVPVQVVTPSELHRFFRDKVLAEARPI